MNVPRGSPPPALGSAKKVTAVRCDENMHARTGGNTLDGLQVISLGYKEEQRILLYQLQLKSSTEIQ